jgi:hypothetical protein
MTPRAVPQPRAFAGPANTWRRVLHARGTAVAVVWGATVLISVLSPDLVSGSSHRHLPVAALTAWVWALLATVFLRLPRAASLPRQTVGFITGVWAAATVLAISAPAVMTGQDAAEIPLMACLTPVLAALATGYALLAWLAEDRPVAQRP